MEPNHASVRPPRTTTRPNYDDAAAVTQPVIKKEDIFDDDDDTYKSRPRLQAPLVLMRNLAQLMSR